MNRLTRWATAFASLVGAVSACSSEPGEAPIERTETTQAASTSEYDWLQFYGNAQHTGNNTVETQITAQNVSTLGQLFQVALPGKADGPPAILTAVMTSSGVRDLAFVTTSDGHTAAVDAHTGALVWSVLKTGPNFTTSAPAIDPSLAYVYSYGLDGFVHKYAVGTGVETTTGGWPEAATLKPSIEKGSTSLAINTVGATSYLYIGYSGYGDGGDYQGHLTAINLSTGAQNVFNSVCSNLPEHFVTGGSPDCPYVQSAIWGRSAAVYDADTNKIYAGTGNGTFDPTTFQWGDTVLALNPDGTGTAGGPLDSYTPSVFATLQSSDLDLGSASPAILPGSGATVPHIALQSGKDAVLRLINLDNLSGQGGPGHVGGELFSVTMPGGGTVANGMPVWESPVDQSTWVFVATYAGELLAYRLSVNGSGAPSLIAEWEQTTPATGGSLLVANNVLYSAINNSIRALDPTTGNVLWSASNIGTIHWQSPVVANGVLYIADNSSQLTAYALNQATLVALSRTGWVASASVSSGASPPPNAIDGSSTTRWSTGKAQANGQWFQVNMLAPQTFAEITLDAASSTSDYPRGYQVFVSNDGATWGNAIASGAGTAALVPITFPQQTAQYIRVVQTGTATNWWSIAEMNVYGPSSQPPPPPGAPSGLAATAASTSAIDLSWQASATSGVTYSVFRSTSSSFTPGPTNSVATGLTGLTYADSGLVASTTYFYYVEAVGSTGTSGPSNEGSAMTQSSATTVQIDCGGAAASPFVADEDFTGGATLDHANTIDVSGVTNPAPQAVYQTARVDNFSYTIPGFAASSSHTVRLHFAETYFSTAGSRTFNVTINGDQVLTKFDIYQAAGAKNKAIVEAYTLPANASGQYVIQFTSVVNNSLVSGIEIQ